MALITVNPADNPVTKVSGGAANDIVEFAPAGGTEWRLTAPIIPKAGMTLRAAAGADLDQIKINIAKLITGWAGASPRFTASVSGGVPGPTVAAANQTPSGGFLYPQSAYAETIYVRNTGDAIATPSVPLWKVGVVDASGAAVGAAASSVGTPGSTPAGYIGTCHINYQTDVVTISIAQTGKTIEVSNNKVAINCTANDVDVSGMTVAGSSTRGVWANGGVRCVFHDGRSYNNHIGLSLAGTLSATSSPVASSTNHNGIARNWQTMYNGQYGCNSTADFVTFDTVEIHHCNHLRLYNTSGANFASGGCKFSGTGTQLAGSGVQMLTCNVHDNWGNGGWLDLGNINWLIQDCIFQNNSSHGCVIEINYTGTFTGNYVYDNGDNGLYVSTTKDSFFYGNYFSGNGNWHVRVLDAARGGTYRGINNTFGGSGALRNFFWHEGTALIGFQANGAPDTQVWSTNTFTNNKHYLQSPDPSGAAGLFNIQSGRTNYAGWQAAGFDVGISAGLISATQRPPAGGSITPPDAPTVTATAGGNALAQNAHTLELSAVLTFSASGATSYEANIDGAGFATAVSPLTVSALAFGNHSVQVRGVNDGGAGAAATFSWVVDSPPAPTVTATDGTNPLTNGGATQQTGAVFTYSASGATGYQVSVDGAAFTSHASPDTLSGLALGTHTFAARGTNASGFGATTTFTWTVQSGPPPPQPPAPPTVTAVVASQTFPNGGSTPQTGIILTFSSSGATSYQRSLDGGGYSTVTSPQTLSGLSVAAHTFAVRAVNSDGTSASTTFSWTVTAAPPGVVALAAEVGGIPIANGDTTTIKSIDLTFGATGATSYQYSVDGTAYVTASVSPITVGPLSYAAHTVSIRGVNTAGPGPATTFAWTIAKPPRRHYRAGGNGKVAGTGVIQGSRIFPGGS